MSSSSDEEELKDQVKDNLDFDRLKNDDELDFSDNSDNEAKNDEEFMKQFALKNDSQKLLCIAERTQNLYKKAFDFDNKMIELNKQYNFLDKDMKY